jgi:hypothetical protein
MEIKLVKFLLTKWIELNSNGNMKNELLNDLEIKIVKFLLTKWIELNSNGNIKNELLKDLENGKKFRYSLSKYSNGNDILDVVFYSPNKIEYSVDMSELINLKQ